MTVGPCLPLLGLATNAALPILIDSTVKGAILLSLVALVVCKWRRTSAARRHAVWATATIGLLGLPFLSAILPAWSVLPSWLNVTATPVSANPSTPVLPRFVPNERSTVAEIEPQASIARVSGPGESEDRIQSSTVAPTATPKFDQNAVETKNVDGLPSVEPRLLTTVNDANFAEPSLNHTKVAPVAGSADLSLSFYVWICGIWTVGASLLLARLICSQLSLWRLASISCRVTEGVLWNEVQRLAVSLGIHRSIQLYLSAGRQIPMTWGLWTPQLLLPTQSLQWDSGRLRSVLMHELAHVARWDCLTQLFAQISCAVHWLNPLVWMAADRMAVEREQACDDVALSSGIDAADYAEHLVGIAAGLSPHDLATYGAMAMARPSRLEGRLLMVLNASLNRRNVTTGWLLSTALAILLIVLPISSLTAVGITPPPVETTKNSNQAETQALPAKPEPTVKPALKPVLADAEWSAIIDGFQFRLAAERTDFQSWELPTFLVEIRNRDQHPVTAARANAIFGYFRRKPGLLFLFQNQHRRAPNPNRWLIPEVRLDVQKLIGLQQGESILQTATLTSMREESSPEWAPYALSPGRYTLGIGIIAADLKDDLKTNAVTLNLLPPGISNRDELTPFVKSYRFDGHSLMAGFVPNKTRIVYGEPIIATFLVQNQADQPFTFGFGGDYRSNGRHERFKIEVTDAHGKPLVDPTPGFDGDGILMWRTAQARDAAVETVNLGIYRSFPGPGKYSVTCRFDLTPSWTNEGQQKFQVPVETSFKLTILPREPVQVERVLNEMFDRSNKTGSGALVQLIEMISSFGKEAAVPGLGKMVTSGDVEHRIAAATGLGKITTSESLEILLPASREPQLAVRVAALTSLGSFADPRAVQTLAEAMSDPDESIRKAAAKALGTAKTGSAVDALIRRLPDSSPPVRAAILRAMGETKSPRVFEILEQSLSSQDGIVRRGALDGIIQFPAEQAVEVLRKHVRHPDLDFREEVIHKLARDLHQSIDPQWLVPVIQSRKRATSIGDAPRLLRLYTDDKAAPTLLSCLDFENPDIRNYYNLTIIDNQLACNGLAIPWTGDLNRPGTPTEIESNRLILKHIKEWIEHSQAHPYDEPTLPWHLPSPNEERTWGEPVDGLSIRGRVNRIVWPAGLPQVIIIEARSEPGQGSTTFNARPDPYLVEVDGESYSLDPAADMKVNGNWQAYHGLPWQNLQIDKRWINTVSKRPLELKPGKHTVRVLLSITPAGKRTGLAACKPIQFEVLASQ